MAPRGFSLLELIVTLAVMAVIVSIAVVRVGRHASNARARGEEEATRNLAMAVEAFTVDHAGRSPVRWINGDVDEDETRFWKRLTGELPEDGAIGGPYISQRPRNPLNGRDCMRVIHAPEPPKSTCGWTFDVSTDVLASDALAAD